MKNALKLFAIFTILCILILVGKASNWSLHYDANTNQLLNIVTFSLVGAGYIFGGLFILNKKLVKILFILCGIYLIAMHFIPNFDFKTLIGFIAIITPMLSAKFSTTRERLE